LRTIIDRAFSLLAHFCVGSLAVLVVLVFTNVALRFLFSSGITLFEELSRWVFVWMVFMGALIALRNNTHLGTDIVVSQLPGPLKKLAMIAGFLVTLGCIVVFVVGSWTQFMVSKDITAPVSDLSMGWFYGAGLVFGVAALLILVARGLRLATGHFDIDAAPNSEDSSSDAGRLNLQ
jgi:TRAP-type C4-dicarboxylate transport system permease small subunit